MENLPTRPRLVTGAAGATVLTVLLTVAATVAGLVAANTNLVKPSNQTGAPLRYMVRHPSPISG